MPLDAAAISPELETYIDSLDSTDGMLMPVLHKAQELYGYLPVTVQNHIAERLKLPAAKVFGVVTFYSFFNTAPKGQFQISVCMGTACFVRDAGAVLERFKSQLKIEPGGVSDDMMFSLDAIRCVGACGLAPVVSVNGKVYGRVIPDDVEGIVEEYLVKGGQNEERNED